eukprot:1157473-Pelagomonas_calceolata.AAC.10
MMRTTIQQGTCRGATNVWASPANTDESTITLSGVCMSLPSGKPTLQNLVNPLSVPAYFNERMAEECQAHSVRMQPFKRRLSPTGKIGGVSERGVSAYFNQRLAGTPSSSWNVAAAAAEGTVTDMMQAFNSICAHQAQEHMQGLIACLQMSLPLCKQVAKKGSHTASF